MTVAGIALIAGGLAILVVFRRLLWGGAGAQSRGSNGESGAAAVPDPGRSGSGRRRAAVEHTPAADLFPEGFFSDPRNVAPPGHEDDVTPVSPAPHEPASHGIVTLGLADDEGALGPAPMGELFDHIELPSARAAAASSPVDADELDAHDPADADVGDPASADVADPAVGNVVDPPVPAHSTDGRNADGRSTDGRLADDRAEADPEVAGFGEADVRDRELSDLAVVLAGPGDEPEHTVKLEDLPPSETPSDVDRAEPVVAGYRYGDRVDGWVRPDYGNRLAESEPAPAGEYWLPVSDPYADAATGWATAGRARDDGRAGDVAASRDWASLGDVAPVVEPMPAPSFDAAAVFAPTWPPPGYPVTAPANPPRRMPTDPSRRTPTRASRHAPNDTDGPAPASAGHPIDPLGAVLPAPELPGYAGASPSDGDAERAGRHFTRRPRPRPRPSNTSPAEERPPARSTVYVSRHAAEPT